MSRTKAKSATQVTEEWILKVIRQFGKGWKLEHIERSWWKITEGYGVAIFVKFGSVAKAVVMYPGVCHNHKIIGASFRRMVNDRHEVDLETEMALAMQDLETFRSRMTEARNEVLSFEDLERLQEPLWKALFESEPDDLGLEMLVTRNSSSFAGLGLDRMSTLYRVMANVVEGGLPLPDSEGGRKRSTGALRSEHSVIEKAIVAWNKVIG